MDLIKALNNEQLKENVPVINVGDTVRVSNKIKEGTREREFSSSRALSSPRTAAASPRPSPSDAFPMASASRRPSRYILRTLRR